MTLNQAKARNQLDRDPGTFRFGPVTRQSASAYHAPIGARDQHYHHIHVTMPEPQFTIHTRYGTEHHHQADEHRAGPSCPCGPRIQWLGRSEK